jgi:hypothetical protein
VSFLGTHAAIVSAVLTKRYTSIQSR